MTLSEVAVVSGWPEALTMSEPIVVHHRRTVLGAIAFGAFVFVACAPRIALRAVATGGSDLVIGLATAATGILFFGSVLRFAWRKMVSDEPALVITDQGLDERSSIGSAGFIPWDDVAGIGREGIWPFGFIVLQMKEPGEFIRRLPLGLPFHAYANRLLGYGPVNIAPLTLDMPARELEQLLEKRRDGAQRWT